MVTLQENYLNVYEGIRNRYKSSALYNDADWKYWADKGELQSYAGYMQYQHKMPSLSFLEEKYHWSRMTPEYRKLMFYRELQADRTEITEHTLYDYDEAGKETSKKVSMTEYDYYGHVIDNWVKNEDNKIALEAFKELKEENANFFKDAKGIIGNLGLGLTKSLFDIANFASSVGTGFATLVNGGNFLEGFRSDMADDKLAGLDFGSYGMDEIIEEFRRYEYENVRYVNEDGSYTSAGRWLTGAAYSIGQMLPSILVGAAAGAAGVSSSVTAGLQQGVYYGSMFSGSMNETFSDASYDKVRTDAIIAESLITTALDYGVEKLSGKLFGTTAVDNLVLGMTGGSKSTNFVIRAAKDALVEGMEEVVQETTAWFASATTGMLYNDDTFYKELTWQQLTDAFMTSVISSGIITSVSSSINAVRHRIATRQEFKKLLELEADYNSLKGFDKLARRSNIRKTAEVIGTIYQAIHEVQEKSKQDLATRNWLNENNEEIVGLLMQSYAGFRTLTRSLGNMTPARLTQVASYLNYLERLYVPVLGEQVREQMHEKYQPTERLNKALEHFQKIIDDKKKNGPAIINDDKDGQIVDYTENGEFKNGTDNPQAQNIAKEAAEDGIDVVLTDTNDVEIEGGVLFTSAVKANKAKYSELLKTAVKSKFVKETIKILPKGLTDELLTTFANIVGKSYANKTKMVTALLFDSNFLTIALHCHEQEIVKVLTRLDKLVDTLQEDNKAVHTEFEVLQREVADNVRKSLRIYYADNTSASAYYNDLSILTEEDKKYIAKVRYLYENIYKIVLDGNRIPKQFIPMLKTRINSINISKEIKEGYLNLLERGSVSEQLMVLNKIDAAYDNIFKGKYDDKILLSSKTAPAQAFNVLLRNNGLTVTQVMAASEELKLTVAEQYSRMNAGFTVNLFGKEPTFQEVAPIPYASKQKIREVLNGDDVVVKALKTDTRGTKYRNKWIFEYTGGIPVADKLYNKSVTKQVQSYTTIDDIIGNPEKYLAKEHLDKIAKKYKYVNSYFTYLYLNNYIVENTNAEYALTQLDTGDVVVVQYRDKDKIMHDHISNRAPNLTTLSYELKASKKGVKLSKYIDGKFLHGLAEDTVVKAVVLSDAEYAQSTDSASYDPKSNTLTIYMTSKGISNALFKYILLHEFQHVVQTQNHFVGGFSAASNFTPSTAMIEDIMVHYPGVLPDDFTIEQYNVMSQSNQEQINGVIREFVYKLSGELYAYGSSAAYREISSIVLRMDNKSNKLVLTFPHGTSYTIDNDGKVESSIRKITDKIDAFFNWADYKDYCKYYDLIVNGDINNLPDMDVPIFINSTRELELMSPSKSVWDMVFDKYNRSGRATIHVATAKLSELTKFNPTAHGIEYIVSEFGEELYSSPGVNLYRRLRYGTFNIEDLIEPFSPAFYSQLERTILDSPQNKFSASQVVPFLKGKGVTALELKWFDLDGWLKDKKSVTKDELLEYLRLNCLDIEESYGYRKWDKYTVSRQYAWAMPQHYTEYLFKLPPKSGMDYINRAMNTHWGQSNVLAHARTEEIYDFDDYERIHSRYLFIDEIQSDWHNEGRKHGYNKDITDEDVYDMADKLDPSEYWKNYEDLSFIQREYVSVLEKIVQHLRADGLRAVYEYQDAYQDDGIIHGVYEARELLGEDVALQWQSMLEFVYTPKTAFDSDTYSDYVLKALLRKAAEKDLDGIAWTTSEVQATRWGDKFKSGYENVYDRNFVKFLNKYGKQWGAQVDKKTFDVIENAGPQWYFPLTEQMKDDILYEGQPSFGAHKIYKKSIDLPDGGKFKMSLSKVDDITVQEDLNRLGPWYDITNLPEYELYSRLYKDNGSRTLRERFPDLTDEEYDELVIPVAVEEDTYTNSGLEVPVEVLVPDDGLTRFLDRIVDKKFFIASVKAKHLITNVLTYSPDRKNVRILVPDDALVYQDMRRLVSPVPNGPLSIDEVKSRYYEILTALDNVADEKYKNPFRTQDYEELAKKAFDVAERLGTGFNILYKNKGTAGSYSAAHEVYYNPRYFYNTPSVELYERSANTILHEILHAVTVYAVEFATGERRINVDALTPEQHAIYRDFLTAGKALQGIYEELSTKHKDKFKGSTGVTMYGLKDVHEMVAELANPTFVKRLKKVRIWDALVDILCAILGIKRKNTAYDRIYGLVDRIMSTPSSTLLYGSYATPKTKRQMSLEKTEDIKTSKGIRSGPAPARITPRGKRSYVKTAELTGNLKYYDKRNSNGGYPVMLTDNAVEFIKNADLDKLDPEVAAAIIGGEPEQRFYTLFQQRYDQLNEYTFNLYNKYLFKNPYIKSKTDVNVFANGMPYFYTLLNNRTAVKKYDGLVLSTYEGTPQEWREMINRYFSDQSSELYEKLGDNIVKFTGKKIDGTSAKKAEQTDSSNTENKEQSDSSTDEDGGKVSKSKQVIGDVVTDMVDVGYIAYSIMRYMDGSSVALDQIFTRAKVIRDQGLRTVTTTVASNSLEGFVENTVASDVILTGAEADIVGKWGEIFTTVTTQKRAIVQEKYGDKSPEVQNRAFKQLMSQYMFNILTKYKLLDTVLAYEIIRDNRTIARYDKELLEHPNVKPLLNKKFSKELMKAAFSTTKGTDYVFTKLSMILTRYTSIENEQDVLHKNVLKMVNDEYQKVLFVQDVGGSVPVENVKVTYNVKKLGDQIRQVAGHIEDRVSREMLSRIDEADGGKFKGWIDKKTLKVNHDLWLDKSGEQRTQVLEDLKRLREIITYMRRETINTERLAKRNDRNTIRRERAEKQLDSIKDRYNKSKDTVTSLTAEISNLKEQLKTAKTQASADKINERLANARKERDEADALRKKHWVELNKVRKERDALKTQVAELKQENSRLKFNTGKGAKVEDTVEIASEHTAPKILEDLLSTAFSRYRDTDLQYIAREGEQNIILSAKEFYTLTADTWNTIITENRVDDAEAIIDYFSSYTVDGTTEQKRVVDTLKVLIVGEIYRLAVQNQISLSEEAAERARTLLDIEVRTVSTELTAWRDVLNRLNPERLIATASFKTMWGVDVEEDAASIAQSIKAGKVDGIDAVNNILAQKLLETSKPTSKFETVLHKLFVLQRTAMLSNPGTWVRNMVSNIMISGINPLADAIGKIFIKGDKFKEGQVDLTSVKVTLDSNKPIKDFIKNELYDSGLMALLGESLSKYDPSLKTTITSEKMTDDDKAVALLTKMIMHATQVKVSKINDTYFGKSKAGKYISKAVQFVYKANADSAEYNPEKGYRWNDFIGNAFRKYLEQLIVIKKVDITKGFNTSEMLNAIAEAYSLAGYEYMHKRNFLSDIEQDLAKRSKTAYYIYKMCFAPFLSAGINWFNEALNLSPVGIFKALINLAKLEKTVEKLEDKLQKGEQISTSIELQQMLARRTLGKGIIGTLLFVVGMMLGWLGVIDIDDEDYGKPKIVVGDMYIDISNLLGSSALLVGAQMTKRSNLQYDKKLGKVTIDITQVVINALEYQFEDFVLTNVINSLKGYTDFEKLLTDFPYTIINGFIPNIIKSLNKATYNREIKYSSGNMWQNIWGNIQRLGVSLIPGIAYAMPSKIDPYTGELEYQYVNDYKAVPVLMDALQSLSPINIKSYDLSKSEQIAKKYGVNKNELTGKYKELEKLGVSQLDKVVLNSKYGQLNNQAIMEFVNNSKKYTVEVKLSSGKTVRKDLYYKDMTEEQIKSVLNRITTQNAEIAKIYTWTKSGHKYYCTADRRRELLKYDVTNVFIGDKGFVS